MIEWATKGVPMKPGTRKDIAGYHYGKLDPAKHDPFDVFLRLARAAGAPAVDDPAALARLAELWAKQDSIDYKCKGEKCLKPAACEGAGRCLL